MSIPNRNGYSESPFVGVQSKKNNVQENIETQQFRGFESESQESKNKKNEPNEKGEKFS